MADQRFDRIRPPREGGRGSLTPGAGGGAGGAVPRGDPGGAVGGGGGLLGLALHCSRCGRATPLGVGAALRAAIPLFLVLPWREHPVFALCQACGHRAWLRVASGGEP